MICVDGANHRRRVRDPGEWLPRQARHVRVVVQRCEDERMGLSLCFYLGDTDAIVQAVADLELERLEDPGTATGTTGNGAPCGLPRRGIRAYEPYVDTGRDSPNVSAAPRS
jgi:hypothetical protein